MVGRWSEGLVMGGVISMLNVLFFNHKLLQQIIAQSTTIDKLINIDLKDESGVARRLFNRLQDSSSTILGCRWSKIATQK